MARYIKIEDWEHEDATDEKPVVFEIQPHGDTDFDQLYRMIGDVITGAGLNMGYGEAVD